MESTPRKPKRARGGFTKCGNAKWMGRERWRLQFSQFLNARLRPMDLNRREFAKHMGVSVGDVSSWLNAYAAPSRKRALVVAKKFNAVDEVTRMYFECFPTRQVSRAAGLANGTRFLNGIADGFDALPRFGETTDVPEGARYVLVSDTMAREMATAMRELFAKIGAVKY